MRKREVEKRRRKKATNMRLLGGHDCLTQRIEDTLEKKEEGREGGEGGKG